MHVHTVRKFPFPSHYDIISLISSSPLLPSSHICTCNPSPPLFTFPSPYPSSLQSQPSPLPSPCLTMLPSVAWKTRSVKVAVSQMCPTQEGSMMGRPALTAICSKEHAPLPDQSSLYIRTYLQYTHWPHSVLMCVSGSSKVKLPTPGTSYVCTTWLGCSAISPTTGLKWLRRPYT